MEQLLPLHAAYGVRVPGEMLMTIAENVGLPISHPLFLDATELYHESLRFAHTRIWPNWSQEDSEELERMIPADAIEKFVEESFKRCHQHADAVRLIVAENMFHRTNLGTSVGVLEDSPVVLVVDRLLMRGHDVGAFRNRVSAEDVFVLITALCAFPATQGPAFHALYGMDVTDEQNNAGMIRLAQDAVVAFLTTTKATSQGNSYTHASQSNTLGSSVADSLYASEHFYAEDSDS